MPSLLHRFLKNPRLWQLALAGYWMALFVGTHIPIDQLALSRGSMDKFAHVAAFAMLAILAATAWRLSLGRLNSRQLVWIWAVVVLYGAIEETTQPLTNRAASVIDWLADAIGAALGLTVFWLLSDRWLDKLAPTSEITSQEHRGNLWPRYSLRLVFLAMAAAALVCYWLMLPTMNAQRFVRALQQREYATAESLFMASSKEFPGEFKKFAFAEFEPRLLPLTWSELWKGERRVLVTINYGNEGATARGGAGIFAYRRGLAMHPLVLPFRKPLPES
jgi:VanZ family protein